MASDRRLLNTAYSLSLEIFPVTPEPHKVGGGLVVEALVLQTNERRPVSCELFIERLPDRSGVGIFRTHLKFHNGRTKNVDFIQGTPLEAVGKILLGDAVEFGYEEMTL